MARHKLSDSRVKALSEPGIYGDGDGLYLRVQKTGGRSWVFIWRRFGVRREIGLGPYGSGAGHVSLAAARVKAEEARSIVGAGGDPKTDLSERRSAGATFGTIADQYIATMQSKWRGGKTLAAWERFANNYAKSLRATPVDKVSTDDVVRVLRPLWREKQETASKVRERIKLVLDHAKARGLRAGDNPAQWKGHLDQILPAPSALERGHHAAVPYAEVPAMVARIRALDGFGGKALEFAILTAARSAEVREATWDEVDLEAAVWTIPSTRTKTGKVHRVPLSPRAVEILRGMLATRMNDLVFPGMREGRPLSDMTLAKALTSAGGGDFTVHGFRSSFRDWTAEETNFQREVAEAALAHAVGDSVERAYRRGDALEKRRKLMDAWGQFVEGLTSPNVLRLQTA